MPYVSIITLDNRGMKIQWKIKKKLPLQFCMNGITIMICQLGLIQLANGKKDVNKRISRPFFNKYI